MPKNAVRIECNVDGYEGNWIEFAAGSSRADIVDWNAAKTNEELWAFLRNKATACHLELTDGATIDTPAGITEEGTLQLPIVLEGFLGSAFGVYIARQRTLGNLSARPSSSGNAKPATVAAPTSPQ